MRTPLSSVCRVMALILTEIDGGTGLKPASRDPSLPSRARPLRKVPFTVVKLPPMTIWLSGCTAMALTGPSTVALKVVSRLPSDRSLTRFCQTTALRVS